MSEYEPGTVADITGLQDDEYRAIRVPGGWSLATGWADMLTDELVTDVRPLVVLDLSDWTPESIQALPEWLRHKCSDAPSETAVRYIANLLEAQTRPPKPAEPQGLGAVVETPGGRYVRSTPQRTLRMRAWRWMYDREWTHGHMDDTLRSRAAHAIYEWKKWYDWGHPVMWLVGRYESGNAGCPRGRDLWWIPVEYVEGVAASLVADYERRFGCYVTRRYDDVRATSPDIEWRIYDLQDDGRTVKIGVWPHSPEHGGRVQPMPTWHTMNANREMRLFLWWYLWEHKGKAQWFGLRRWAYYKALHWAVNAHSPFACGVAPERGAGGYSHWHCQLRKRHRGPHRYVNYVWPGPGSHVEYAPAEAGGAS